MIRKTLITVIAFAALAVVPAAASAAAPPSLAGEVLQTSSGPGQPFFGVSCADAASPGGASFSVTGPAVGPYVGTFTETGTIKFDQSTNAFSFKASFTITADDGTVITGTKSDLGGTGDFRAPACSGDSLAFGAGVGYSATIKTSSGSFHDEGTGTVDDVGPSGFTESFDTSTTGTPTPLAPTTTSQCKKGGWMTYGTTFKNQGDCVSFVATGGRNAGAGS